MKNYHYVIGNGLFLPSLSMILMVASLSPMFTLGRMLLVLRVTENCSVPSVISSSWRPTDKHIGCSKLDWVNERSCGELM